MYFAVQLRKLIPDSNGDTREEDSISVSFDEAAQDFYLNKKLSKVFAAVEIVGHLVKSKQLFMDHRRYTGNSFYIALAATIITTAMTFSMQTSYIDLFLIALLTTMTLACHLAYGWLGNKINEADEVIQESMKTIRQIDSLVRSKGFFLVFEVVETRQQLEQKLKKFNR